MEKTDRHIMPTQAADIRICNFEEVTLGYDNETAIAEAKRCLRCKNAPCMTGCPVGVRIPEFIARIAVGDNDNAAEILCNDNNLPAICGRVCPQESQCEKYCVRNKSGGAVAIGALERFAADFALKRGRMVDRDNQNEIENKINSNQHNEDIQSYKDTSEAIQNGAANLAEPNNDNQNESENEINSNQHDEDTQSYKDISEAIQNGGADLVASETKQNGTSNNPTINSSIYKNKSVAVVGSGPSSLSCAADLARVGVAVTIFEALHKAGGVLVYGIPEFRLPKDIVQKEINNLATLGVKIETNVVVGKTLKIDELLDGYDAVFIGTGAGLPSFMRIKGENLNGVYSANEYLTRVNLMNAYRRDSATPLFRGKNVVVVGAGNVAMDSARTARRLGASVHLVYRRSRAEMPARLEEITHAEEEGIVFELLTNPIEILGEGGRVCGIRCQRMKLGEQDASGRRSPIEIAGSEFDIECDEVIVALGTTPNPIIKNSFPSLSVGRGGTIDADENGKTNIPHLYTGGDAMTGAATVILAMGAGKRAARAMIAEWQ